MGIYEETYEKISYRIKQSELKEKTVIPDGTNEDDALVIDNEFLVNNSFLTLVCSRICFSC